MPGFKPRVNCLPRPHYCQKIGYLAYPILTSHSYMNPQEVTEPIISLRKMSATLGTLTRIRHPQSRRHHKSMLTSHTTVLCFSEPLLVIGIKVPPTPG